MALLASACADAKRLPVRVYTTSDGLPLDNVSCIVPDSHGLLWLCTSEGLSRFDGYEFTNYTTADGLPSNRVFDFLETRNGVYWVATSRGLCRLAEPRDWNQGPNGSRLSSPRAPSRMPGFVKYDSSHFMGEAITVLAEGPDGAVWCGGTHRALYRMDGNRSDTVVTSVNLDSLLESVSSDTAETLVVDDAGTVWMGTLNGLYRYDPRGRARHYTVRDGLPENAVHSLYATPDGCLWIGTGAGLCRTGSNPEGGQRLVDRTYTTRDGLPANWINIMRRSSDGNFWIGTGEGLAEFEPHPKPGSRQFRNLTAEVGVPAGVDALAEDQEGNLWLGTGGRGAVKIIRNGFSTYSEADGLPPLGGVSAIFFDRLGNLCLGSAKELFYLDGQRFGAVQPPLPAAIKDFGWGFGQTLFQDHAGEWWVATGQGLCRFSRVASARELGRARLLDVYTTRDGLAGNDIFCIFEDSHGDIWVSTIAPDSLARWERKTDSIHDWAGWSRSEHTVSGFAEDSAGDLWMSLWQGGFVRYRAGRMEQFLPGGQVPPGLKAVPFIDREGRLWAGGRAGVCRIDRVTAEHPQFVTYGPAQGLSSTFASGIAEDREGGIFIATARGIDRLEPESGRVRHYTAADGLTPGAPELLVCDRHGALWVTTKGGVSQLVPQPGPRRSPPSVFITGLRIRSLSFPISAHGEASIAELELGPNENQLALDFVSPSLGAGEALRYQYMLAGADHDWGVPTDQRTVNYATLSPGSYRFLVRAVSADGLASPDPAIVSFRILPPIWRRWWFLTLAATLMGLAAYTIYRYRLERFLELERVRTRIATDLHDDIGTSLSGMAFLSEVVKQQIGNSHAEASQMAAEVAATARSLADALGDVVWSVDPRRDDLGNLIIHVRRFASRVLEAQGIVWRSQAPPEPEKVKLAPEQRRHLLLIFKEAINNIAKHAGCASVTLAISITAHRLEAEIEDDGRGFDPACRDRPAAHSGGNGLGNMKLRAGQLGGHLDIDSAPGRGTRLKLTVPL